MRIFLFTFCLIFCVSCKTYEAEILPIGLHDLQALIQNESDTTYVINFWATWCSPCVNEIGYFEELHRSLSKENLQVVLVNLDFPTDINERVLPFLAEKKISAKVLNITEMDYNSWIPLVDSSWSGAIPATLVFNKQKRSFFEKELSRDDIFQITNEHLKHVKQ